MGWLHNITLWLLHFATEVPLETFVFVGSFIEEIIGPIPTTVVMTTAGFMARIQHHTLAYIFWLAVVGNLGKTVATYAYYFLGERLEILFVGKFGRFFKVKEEDIQSIGKYFGNNLWRDGVFLFLARLIPFFPTMIVSLACGVIKLDLRVYLGATFFGNFGKDLLYIYAGFVGDRLLRSLGRGSERLGFEIDILLLLLVVGLLVFGYVHREKGKKFFQELRERFHVKGERK